MKSTPRPQAIWSILLLTLGLVADSRAMQLSSATGTPPPAETRPAAPSAQATGAARTLDLVSGTVDRVDVAHATVVLNGQALRWHPSQLRVFHAVSGEIGHVTQLRSGMAVRFALEPGNPPDRRIVLLYLEAQP